ncbi:MAG: RIP metalloprotease RseP [Deltaproteobacteria bacterium]|nr:RIP metalloprotease RseP [Deltaproteobacteria bacterium]
MEYIFGFILLLGVLIFVHEFGHFIVAKLLGVKVLKFSLGFSPVMIKRKWGETEYMLSWIPLGGYVKLYGEDPESEEEIEPEDKDRAFTSKSVWVRMAIVAAGPVFNFVFAVMLLCAGFASGFPVLASQIGKALPNSPAIEAGFQPGDTIKAIDGQPVWRWDDVRNIIEDSAGRSLRFTIERNNKTLDVSVTPALSDQKDIFGELKGRIGIAPSGKRVELGFFASINEGVRFSGYLTKLVLMTLVKLVRGEIGMKALSGPITIAQASGESLKAGLFSFIFLMSYISINLAIINLLPIPILDGGHLLFFLIEMVTNKPVTGKIREIAVQLGLLIIVFLIGLVFFNDIYRIVTKGWTLSP